MMEILFYKKKDYLLVASQGFCCSNWVKKFEAVCLNGMTLKKAGRWESKDDESQLSLGIQHVCLQLTGCRLLNEHRLNCTNEHNSTWRNSRFSNVWRTWHLHLMQGKTKGPDFIQTLTRCQNHILQLWNFLLTAYLLRMALKMVLFLALKRLCTSKAVSWLKRLVAGLSPRRPEFDPGSVHVGFVVDKVARTGFSQSTSVFPLSISFHRSSIKREKQKKPHNLPHSVAQ